MEFDWWGTIQASETLLNVHTSVMIGDILIGLWMLFSWYVFGMLIVSKGVGKTCFNLKMMQKVRPKPFTSQEISTF